MEWKKQEGLGIWIPENEGAVLEGEIVNINSEAQYGTQYTVRTKNGDEILTPSHKVLQNRMQKAKIGTKVRIIYKGTEPPKVKGQNPTEMYEVYFGE